MHASYRDMALTCFQICSAQTDQMRSQCTQKNSTATTVAATRILYAAHIECKLWARGAQFHQQLRLQFLNTFAFFLSLIHRWLLLLLLLFICHKDKTHTCTKLDRFKTQIQLNVSYNRIVLDIRVFPQTQDSQ